MQLTTVIDIPKSKFTICSNHRIMLLGSCFADSVGEHLVRGGFDALVNPFGTLYNPFSIGWILERAIDNIELTDGSPELFKSDDGVWHSWMHHSKFSVASSTALLDNINGMTHQVHDFINKADVLIVTFGTSIIYRLRESGMLVANCHKQLDALFVRERLSCDEISAYWNRIVCKLKRVNPNIRIIFTVSPIRHKRDGMHVNNISKGVLLYAADEIVNNSENNNSMDYFPSYEIMLDELRDYRFYADDMIHPSNIAVEYIWEKFKDTYMDKTTKEYVRVKKKEWARSQHRAIVK